MRQGSSEWHAARAERLTASDFGAALGLNPYCSRQKLWRIKLGMETVERNHHIARGEENEARALWQYQVEAGLLADEVGLVLHPAEQWLGASPDATVGSDGLVEIKCPVGFREAPPAYHLAQVQGQLEITGRDWCDYVQWVDGDIRVTRVHRDAQWWEWALPKLREFWDYVLRMEEPPRMTRRKTKETA